MNTMPARLGVFVASVALATTAPVAFAASAGAAVAVCSNSALTVSHTGEEGASGHGAFVLLFKNTGTATCTLHGYPRVDALNAAGHALATAQRTLSGFAGGAKAVNTVTIAPGHFGSATVEWLNFDPVTTGDCTFSKSVAATPPNTTHRAVVPVSVSICALQVHPTVAGTSGRSNATTTLPSTGAATEDLLRGGGGVLLAGLGLLLVASRRRGHPGRRTVA